MITLTIVQESNLATLLQVELHGTQASPSDLADIEFPEINGSKGLIISGFPQYSTGCVVAHYKNHCSWMGIRDDKVIKEGEFAGQPAFVVIWSLNRAFRQGDAVPLVNAALEVLAPSAAK